MAHNSPPLNFDFQATTPCDPEVVLAMQPYWREIWGNASSSNNRLGLQASAVVGVAREDLADLLRVQPKRLIFTSGATEANNLALLGSARASALKHAKRGHLITVSTEHSSVLDPLRQLQREGFRLTEIQPSSNGLICPQQIMEALEDDTIIVSVMMANNEIGVLQPIAELGSLLRERKIIFHSDAVQAFGQLDFDINELGIDLLTISSHKIYGPKGIGCLVFREDLAILPLQYGGGQEQGLRSGTLPVPLIVGFVKAAEIALSNLEHYRSKYAKLFDQMLNGLQMRIPGLIINGSIDNRLYNNVNLTIPGVSGNVLHKSLKPLISCSTGSACSNGEPSYVLNAIGRNAKEARASLRLSFGRTTTLEEVEQVITILEHLVSGVRQGRKTL